MCIPATVLRTSACEMHDSFLTINYFVMHSNEWMFSCNILWQDIWFSLGSSAVSNSWVLSTFFCQATFGIQKLLLAQTELSHFFFFLSDKDIEVLKEITCLRCQVTRWMMFASMPNCQWPWLYNSQSFCNTIAVLCRSIDITILTSLIQSKWQLIWENG